MQQLSINLLIKIYRISALCLAVNWSVECGAQSPLKAECLRPKGNSNAPVGVIYLHGWFDPTANSGHFISLEKDNREKMQKLADALGVSIALPLAQTITNSKSAGRVRDWNATSTPGSAAKKLQEIESMSKSICAGSQLSAPRSLIGFSSGGFLAREIALQCAAKKADYSNVIMTGAKARAGSSPGGNCAKLLAARATKDDSTNTCVSGVCTQFSELSKRMVDEVKKSGGNAEVLPPYPGNHILPTFEYLQKALDAKAAPESAKPTLTRR